MPTIRSSADLQNNYTEISELYRLLDEGLEEERQGKIRPKNEVMESLKAKMNFY